MTLKPWQTYTLIAALGVMFSMTVSAIVISIAWPDLDFQEQTGSAPFEQVAPDPAKQIAPDPVEQLTLGPTRPRLRRRDPRADARWNPDALAWTIRVQAHRPVRGAAAD